MRGRAGAVVVGCRPNKNFLGEQEPYLEIKKTESDKDEPTRMGESLPLHFGFLNGKTGKWVGASGEGG